MEGAGTLTAFPHDIDQLPQRYLQRESPCSNQRKHFEKQLKVKDSAIQILQDDMKLLKKRLFGRSSEKWTTEDRRQGLLFNDAENIF